MLNWSILGNLQQMAPIQTAQPQAQAAPSPGGGGGMGDGILEGLGGALKGLKSMFGSNPVSAANTAVGNQMSGRPNNPAQASVAQNLLGGGNAGQPQARQQQSPQMQGQPQQQGGSFLGNMVKNVINPNRPLNRAEQAHPGSPSTLDLIKKYEGFSNKPYWDVNAYRTGYGSDTITRANGSIERVKPGMTVTREEADRDLSRRVGQFQQTAMKQVGPENWQKLPEGAKSALTSVTYNYGSLPKGVVGAVRTGDINSIADSVEKLSGHNKGVNYKRRMGEAQLIRNSIGPQSSNQNQTQKPYIPWNGNSPWDAPVLPNNQNKGLLG